MHETLHPRLAHFNEESVTLNTADPTLSLLSDQVLSRASLNQGEQITFQFQDLPATAIQALKQALTDQTLQFVLLSRSEQRPLHVFSRAPQPKGNALFLAHARAILTVLQEHLHDLLIDQMGIALGRTGPGGGGWEPLSVGAAGLIVGLRISGRYTVNESRLCQGMAQLLLQNATLLRTGKHRDQLMS